MLARNWLYSISQILILEASEDVALVCCSCARV